jgi:hypothetical protein
MSDNFEGFIDLGEDLEGIQEPKLLEASRYQLRIVGATAKTDENGNLSQINCRVIAPDVPGSAAIFHTIWLPKAEADADSRNFTLLKMKRFMHLFKVPYSGKGLNTSDFIGREAIANVNLDTYTKKDGSGEGQSNSIVLPMLPR